MKNKMKEYKALMLDIDGTSVPNWSSEMPSKKVTEAIVKAKEKIYVGVATSRPYYVAESIIDHLQLSGPCIVNNGAQVIDARSKEILREQRMLNEDVLAIYNETKKFRLPFIVNTIAGDVRIENESQVKGRILGVVVFTGEEKTADLLYRRISHISTIVVNKMPAFKEEEYCVCASHASATKQYGILEVAKILGISTREIIGVGDGENDFPLLMACGLKVAMGNAIEGLKDMADYIAPSVFEDGVVDVINRFVLKEDVK